MLSYSHNRPTTSASATQHIISNLAITNSFLEKEESSLYIKPVIVIVDPLYLFGLLEAISSVILAKLFASTVKLEFSEIAIVGFLTFL